VPRRIKLVKFWWVLVFVFIKFWWVLVFFE
jgi:hypothetical protein